MTQIVGKYEEHKIVYGQDSTSILIPAVNSWAEWIWSLENWHRLVWLCIYILSHFWLLLLSLWAILKQFFPIHVGSGEQELPVRNVCKMNRFLSGSAKEGSKPGLSPRSPEIQRKGWCSVTLGLIVFVNETSLGLALLCWELLQCWRLNSVPRTC